MSTCWRLAACLVLVLHAMVPRAAAVSLTAEQMRQLQQLSPAQRAALARQAGISLPKKTGKQISNPTVVMPRAAGTGSPEKEAARPPAPEEKAAVSPAPAVVPPVEPVAGKAAAEKAEVRRAFAEYVRESRPMTVDTHLRQFGYDLFAGAPTTFAPATEVPVPSEYVLGPGDELRVQMFGKTNAEYTMTVDREGAIAFPEIGPLNVAGMSFAEARAFIAQQVKEKMIGMSVSVTMGKLRSIRVFALGEVSRPGSYVVSGLATLSHALFVSGGVRKTGSLRKVQLKRAGRLVATLDLYDFLLHGDTSRDVRLLPQDVVYVPPIGPTVGVAGEVLRPAIYELKKEKTLGEVLRLAGGLRPTAYGAKVQIERIKRGREHEVLDVRLDDRGRAMHLRDGDIVKVFSILAFEDNPVYLLGNVKRPGKYAWHKGMRLKEIIPDTKALLPETYMDYGIIEREGGAQREPTILHFPLGSVLAGKAGVALKPRDKIYIFNRLHFREQPMLEIAGSVQKPGRYALKKNMRLVDLLLAAGGLLRDAYRDEAELYRTNPRTKDVTVHRYSLRRALRGDRRHNPLLRDMDRLVVHSIYEKRYREFVSVEGEVKKPGRYRRAVNMRVSDLIFAAQGPTRDTLMGEAQIYRTDDKTKEVSLITFDVGKALQGDEENNPLLRDLDRVVIHSIWEVKRRYKVRIGGEVKKPGAYPLAEGMRVADLVFAAGNVTERAYLRQAEVTRYAVVNGEKRVSEHLQVDLAAALRGEDAANIPLRPYDVLTVRRLSNWRETEHVTLAGEVRFPGTYPIEEGERLSSLIERAGGFTARAYLPAAVFTRASIRAEQQKQLDEMSRRVEADIARQTVAIRGIKDASIMQRQQQALEAAKRVLEQLKQVKATGRLVIQLSDVRHLKGSEYDLRLRDGDRLLVPQRPDQVLVLGQVYNQTALLYRKGLDRGDYIDMAGGPTRFADEGRIYVVRANGEVDAHHGWRLRHIGPGDAIVVPEKLEQFNLVDSMLDWSRVLMQVGVGVASMKTIGIL